MYFSPQSFVPKIKTGHNVQPDVFLAPRGALQTTVNSFPFLVAHAAQRAGTFGDVVFEEVDPRVGAFSQVGGGHVRHAGSLLVVVSRHVVHVGVGVRERLECPVVCTGLGMSNMTKTKQSGSQTTMYDGTCSEGVSVDDPRQEAAQTPHRETTNHTPQLLSDLLSLKSPLRLWGYTNI